MINVTKTTPTIWPIVTNGVLFDLIVLD